jgi:hypothetical protein
MLTFWDRSFFIQLTGGLLTIRSDNPEKNLKGLHIYTAGVCLQEAVILGVVVLVLKLYRRLSAEVPTERQLQAKRLTIALSISLALITVSTTRIRILGDS